MKKSEIVRFLNKWKGPIGFGNRRVLVEIFPPDKPFEDYYASCLVTIHGETLDIKIHPDLFRESLKFQKEVLIHELVHARVELAEDELAAGIESIRRDITERMVNDIVRLIGGRDDSSLSGLLEIRLNSRAQNPIFQKTGKTDHPLFSRVENERFFPLFLILCKIKHL